MAIQRGRYFTCLFVLQRRFLHGGWQKVVMHFAHYGQLLVSPTKFPICIPLRHLLQAYRVVYILDLVLFRGKLLNHLLVS